MKASYIYIYLGVLWTLVNLSNGWRLPRSLGVEDTGSNLTQKRHQEIIQFEALQHFTTTPTTSSEVTTRQDARERISSFIKDVSVIPEDINVQSLKNDDQLHLKYDRKLAVDKELGADLSNNRNKTVKSFKIDFIPHKLDQENSDSKVSGDIFYEHSKAIINKEKGEESKEDVPSILSSTETLKGDPEWKSFEIKKKEKGKKEIFDTVTVPTDYSGAGRIEKPFKDNAINIKLKDKNKDLNSEASDDRRSTTIRISSSSSISISERDNNKSISSVSFPLIDSPSTNEDAVNQSVFSVINNNNVNSDSSQKTRVKYSLKRTKDVVNDTEGDNSSSNGNLLNEDAPNDSVPGVNFESQLPHSTFQTSTTGGEKMTVSEQKLPAQRLKPTESTPTKVDIFEKELPSPTTIAKPSLAFKQQLANKLKGLDPAPTMAISVNGEELDEVQEKSNGKSSTKSSLRKKPKVDYYSSTSELIIPPTATAWTLASMKTSGDTMSTLTSRKPTPLLGETFSASDLVTRPPSRQSTLSTSGSRVKSFVPWSTRLLKSTTPRPSLTSQDINKTSQPASFSLPKEHLSPQNIDPLNKNSAFTKVLDSPPSTVEVQSVIRTTMELERNLTGETSANTIATSLNDMMVKDQSTPRSQASPASEGLILKEQKNVPNPLEVTSNEKVTEKENAIESKLSGVSDNIDRAEAKLPEKLKKETVQNIRNNTANEVLLPDLSQTVNEIKQGNVNNVFNISKSTTATPELDDSAKIKSMSEVSEIDSGDILGDGGGEDGKFGEEFEEEEKFEKHKHTTTFSPNLDHLETTMIPDFDDDDVENEREDDELSVVFETKSAMTKNETLIVNTTTSTENSANIETTTSTVPNPKENSTGAYVTSFDINLRDNTTQIVTQSPSTDNKNWYNVETKTVVNSSEEETSPKPTPAEVEVTTVAEETTTEPETPTEASEPESTLQSETTKTAVTASNLTTTTSDADIVETAVPEGNSKDDEESLSCITIPVACQNPQQLKEYIASQLMNENISWDQVSIMGGDLPECEAKDLQEDDSLFGGHLEVKLCFTDKEGKPSSTILNEFLRFYNKRMSDVNFNVVDLNTKQPPEMENGFDNVLAAIILSVIAAICLVLLGILLVIIRKRQGRFNYGQRCTPVSLDDYSLDNISVHNSVRRKGALRASKRSYGNPGFDDPGGPTHPVNFAGLANFSGDREALDEEFNQIPMITVKPDELPSGAESKNRYANVIPLPETRVLLQPKEGKENTDPLDEYINANYVKGLKSQEKLYIACQAPLQSTIEDFWKMVWQQQTKVILMLTSLHENGVEKCADYLPQLEVTDCHRLFGDFQVTLKKHEVREKYIISSLQLKNLETNLWREVTHMWYSSWPPQGVPDDGSAMIAFLIEARSFMRGAQGPTVVHCSPGTGRTGTVIAIDLCIRDFETQRNVDIPKTVYALRRDRAGAVQTKDQYAFIYQVLNLYATKLTGGALDSI